MYIALQSAEIISEHNHSLRAVIFIQQLHAIGYVCVESVEMVGTKYRKRGIFYTYIEHI